MTTTPDMSTEIARATTAVEALHRSREDRWYPRLHVAAKAGWINDPNGLCFYGGRYHAYFQHHPYGTGWGPMHWGHVSSADLVTWRHEPIALAPSLLEDRDGVFSGSAVVDDDGRLVVFYTGHRWRNGTDEDEGNLQVQCVAVSEDGTTFDKQGVVIDSPEGMLHFRDPKVWRQGDTWYLVVGASADGRGEVWLYSSSDLRDWTFDRVLHRDPRPEVFMLECPDFFFLDGHWVLVCCPMGLRPDGPEARNLHNAGYVVGDWSPGSDFEVREPWRALDRGAQFYAPQTFEHQDGRRILLGWMGAFDTPLPSQEDGWCGQLTVPRELRLRGTTLAMQPLPELQRLRTETVDLGSFRAAPDEDRVLVEDAETVEVELEVDLSASDAERVGLALAATPSGHETLVAYDDLARTVVLDRGRAGCGPRGYRSAPFAGETLSLRVIVDRSSVEVFVGSGETAMSSFVFPPEGPRGVRLVSESGAAQVLGLRVHRLGSAWEDDGA